MTADGRRSWRLLGLIAVLLVATALRLYRLDAQSFWNDEGNAVRTAARSVPLVLEAAQGDIHPPGYYLLLHLWWAAAGESEFAMRSLSAFCGVLMIAFTYRLGRHLLGTAAALGGAVLAALSPLGVYYSQEARMYALLGLLSAASTTFLCGIQGTMYEKRGVAPARRLLSITSHGSGAGLLVGYVLTAAAGLYTHYAFPFVLAVHNLLFLGWWGVSGRRERGGGRLLLGWGALQVLVLLLFLPWLQTAIRSLTGWPSAGRGYGVGPALLEVFRGLTVGVTLEPAQARWAIVLAGAFLLAGFWPRRERAAAAGALALWLLLPVLLIFALDVYKPQYVKFLLAVLPAFHLLLARGVETIAQLARHLLPVADRTARIPSYALRAVGYGLLLALGPVTSLSNLYFNPAYARDDYRQIAADIASLSRPGDGIVLNAPNQWEVFTYYFQEPIPVYPAPYHATGEEAVAWLEPVLGSHERLFVLYWGDRESDPERRIERRLTGHAYPADSRWYGAVRLTIYGVGPLPREPAVDAEAQFGETIRLRGYALGEGAYAPGDVVPVTLFWEADAAIPERYKVFLHLLDAGGNLVAQNDGEPRGNLVPTTSWSPGEVYIDRHGVLLPDDLTAGTYTLGGGLYHLTTGERLQVALMSEPLAHGLLLGSVTVVP